HDDAVEWLLFDPPRGAIAQPRFDIREPETAKPLFGFHQQIGKPLDREDLTAGSEPREDRGLIARARSDLEDTVGAPGLQLFRHERNHVGLRNRLPAADGEWCIGVRVARQMRWQEPLARDPAHRRECSLITN